MIHFDLPRIPRGGVGAAPSNAILPPCGCIAKRGPGTPPTMNKLLHVWIVALALCLATVSPTRAQKKEANEFQRGIELYSRGDKDGAIASFTAWLKKNPKDAVAFYCRGLAKLEKGDPDAAIADNTSAIQLNPKYTDAYLNRGNAKRDKGDPDAAITDYNHAIELNPKYALAYFNRGVAKSKRGNLDAALADYNRAIELDPKVPNFFGGRGVAFYLQKNWLKAHADFEAAARQEKGNFYGALMACVVQLRLGQGETGRKELRTALDHRWDAKPNDWPSKLGDFLLGKLDETALLAAADSPDAIKNREQHCEAWYYDGMVRLAAGKNDEAASCFRKCLATEQKMVDEYQLANTELKWLEGE